MQTLGGYVILFPNHFPFYVIISFLKNNNKDNNNKEDYNNDDNENNDSNDNNNRLIF